MAQNEECCPPQSTSQPSKPNVPHPVSIPRGYESKGSYEAVGSFDKVYVSGPDDAKHALLVVPDIFGFWETTLRGLDPLASHLLLTFPTRIFMPDIFHGQPYPPNKDGQKEVLQKFFAGTAKIDDRLPEVVELGHMLKTMGYEKVSILGYCWGGKVVLLALSSSGPFCCGAIVHPAMIAPEDGAKLAVPLAFFPSADEPKDAVAEIEMAMKAKPFARMCEYKLYDTVYHGWAAARADLADPEVAKQYEDVYQRLADFYAKCK